MIWKRCEKMVQTGHMSMNDAIARVTASTITGGNSDFGTSLGTVKEEEEPKGEERGKRLRGRRKWPGRSLDLEVWG